MDWSEIELAVYGSGPAAEGLFSLPEDGALHSLRLEREGDGFVLREDPLEGKVEWNVRTFATESGRNG
jgi:alpha-D-xyloside xylohydrolase